MTTYSVRKEIKSVASKRKKGKEIIQCLTQSAGGFSKARTVAKFIKLNQVFIRVYYKSEFIINQSLSIIQLVESNLRSKSKEQN